MSTINPSFKPRWYQAEAVNSIFDFFVKNKGKGNPLVIAPPGAGKSHMLGMFCDRVLTNWPAQRILILTHIDTLIEQDYAAVCSHVPAYKVGIFSAGVGKKEKRAVTIAGIQSVCKKPGLFRDTTIILIDEAHTVPHSGQGQYRSFLANFSCPVVGLTATHFRMGSGYLHEGDKRLFTDIAYEVDIERLIEEGYLCTLIPRPPIAQIDTEGAKTAGGEFVRKDIVERATREGLTEAIVDDIVRHTADYKKMLVFCIDIAHGELVTKMLLDRGCSTTLVHSKQSKAENRKAKADFKASRYQALVSIETLTTGFDEPAIDLIALIRPTKSPVLHIQMIGRGLRTSPKKDHCLILDYAGNVGRLGPINDVLVKKKGKKGGQPITKVCPECDTILAGAVKRCPICGHEFIFKEKIKDKAAKNKIVKTTIKPEWHQVTGISYNSHSTAKGHATLLVGYKCGLRTFFEYKPFDQGIKAAYYARFWWKHRTVSRHLPPPSSTSEAVIRAAGGDLLTPTWILVQEGKKYPEIKEFKFN